MEVKVFWTEFAINQLEQIFDYYKYTESLKVSKKIISGIIDSTILLERNPLIGRREPLLENRKKEYRFIVKRNYKIIYFAEGNYVNVSSVFDCRQNPIKITESTKPNL
ncbi:MAG: type II toxin-antitoxin system RelE/ParE family toxin [Bacteroidales bacterium]